MAAPMPPATSMDTSTVIGDSLNVVYPCEQQDILTSTPASAGYQAGYFTPQAQSLTASPDIDPMTIILSKLNAIEHKLDANSTKLDAIERDIGGLKSNVTNLEIKVKALDDMKTHVKAIEDIARNS